MPSEAHIQRTIIDALTMDGWLVLRINQGGRAAGGRYTRFAYWQMLGQEATDTGISDILAIKALPISMERCDGLEAEPIGYTPGVLAIEVKAPGKKANVSHEQAHFLAAIEQHGGIAIVADCMEDVAPYLDSMEVQ